MEDLVIETLFQSAYKNRRVLITGHTGFKGSWLSLWLSLMGAKVTGFSLPERTSPSHFDLLDLKGVSTVEGDIRDASHLERVLQKTEPEIVFHMAAQSLVRESYRNPTETYQTNVIGTLNLFEAIRKTPGVRAVVNVTTDKVYENREWVWPYRENDPLGGYDLYSSSKACAELLSASYRNSFFNLAHYGEHHSLLLATVRAGNVIGGGDWAADRLIPDMARAASQGKTVEIRSPRSIRPWEHVLEPLSGYLLLGMELLKGKKEFSGSWNFGPGEGQTCPVGEIVTRLQTAWPKVSWTNGEDPNHPFHEARILKLDCSKARTELAWQPVWDLEITLRRTANWYQRYYEGGELNTLSDLQAYIRRATEKHIRWTQA